VGSYEHGNEPSDANLVVTSWATVSVSGIIFVESYFRVGSNTTSYLGVSDSNLSQGDHYSD
jgi:hypothetical protein